VIKRIDNRSGAVRAGSILRHLLDEVSAPELRYDPERPIASNELLLGEVISVPGCRYDADLFIGMERIERTARGIQLTVEEAREGLIAIAAGSRYAPRVLLGGMRHPLTGRQGPALRGGDLTSDLISMNVAGPVHRLAVPHERPVIRVLGAWVDAGGQTHRLPRRRPLPDAIAVPAPAGVLVCGAGMETGKTTFCMGVMAAAREHGVRCGYEKKTGTSSARDVLRVVSGNYGVLSAPGCRVELEYDALDGFDYVDGAGVASDVSMDPDAFADLSLRAASPWWQRRPLDLAVVELADNFSHLSNLALLARPEFRRAFQHLVYVAPPSFDAVDHWQRYVRDVLGWRDVALWLAGPLATDEKWACLREECSERLRIQCLPVAHDTGRPPVLAPEHFHRLFAREPVPVC